MVRWRVWQGRCISRGVASQMTSQSRQLMTREDAAKVAANIAARFNEFVAKFDSEKYPERIYKRLLQTYKNVPLREPKKSIPDALRWKYGYWSKSNYPGKQKRLMLRIAESWSTDIRQKTPERAFRKLHSTLQLRYISAAFLTHLMYPEIVPIIDQHNFRAMNALLGRKSRAVPSRFSDLADLRHFIDEVLDAWPRETVKKPDERSLDKFLMAYGKSLKPRKIKKRTTKVGGPPSAPEKSVKPGRGASEVLASPSKMDIARGVYQRMRGQPSAEVRRALMTEAGLTKNGANTYYYKLRKK